MSDTALVLSTQSGMSVDLMVASWLHAKEVKDEWGDKTPIW